ncbi:MAG: flagellar export protein FliJ [Brevinema sp.]
MKKFKFSLQSLLEIREKIEQEQKNKLAIAASEYQKTIDKQKYAFDQVFSAKQKLSQSMQENKISIHQLQQLDLSYKQAEQLSYSLEPEIQKAKKKLDQEKEKYNKYHMDKKALEILRDKEYEKYKKSLLHQENIIMDEISKNQYFRHHK